MKVASWIVVAAALAVAPVPDTVEAQAPDPCDGPAEEHKLKIKLNASGNKPEGVYKGYKKAEEVEVCPGDFVEWKLQGQREFRIEFPKENPFVDLDPESNRFRLRGRIAEDAPRGKRFKYDVALLYGGTHDPVIIIRTRH